MGKSNNWNELQKRSDKIFFMKKEDILNLPYFDQNSTTITINKFFEKSKKEEINKYKKLYKKETKWFIILRVGLKKNDCRRIKTIRLKRIIKFFLLIKKIMKKINEISIKVMMKLYY